MKDAIRTQMREQRQALSPDLYVKKSRRIAEQVPYHDAEKILVYISAKGEVDTHTLIEEMLEAGKMLYAPKIEGKRFQAYPFQTMSELQAGPFGILEPPHGEAEIHFDLILVPGLAFDKRGHRIGYGQGFYDRFLKKATGLKIGLAFQEQMLDEIPIDDQDVPVDLVLTDSLNP